MERKMAVIKKIDGVRAIPDADKICAYQVGGWWVVDQVGKYSVGDLAVYCEIDSFIPTTIAPFLTKPDQYPKVFEGVQGERLRTVRLRGQISQGLLLPIPTGDNFDVGRLAFEISTGAIKEGDDVSDVFGIKKYEAPIPSNLGGEVKGMFPGYIPKTDQERIQNLKSELAEWQRLGYTFERTEKLDGTSMTAFILDGVFSICSRNLELKPNADNTMFKAAAAQELSEKLTLSGRNLALQGELIGNGIQSNKYKYTGQEFRVFDIYDIDAKKYFTPVERKEFVTELNIKHVPVMASAFSLVGLTIDDLLKMAEGKSVMGDITGPEREGDVYKCLEDPSISFKVISNKFLLRNGD
jgi:RNA ligase (TIGR02306 family)